MRLYVEPFDDEVDKSEDSPIGYGTYLSQLPLDKMATILADDILKCIFLNENHRILIQISLKFFSNGPIDNNPALV